VLFRAKNLPIPAIHGEDALHDWHPKPPFRQGPPSLGRGRRCFAYFTAKARSRPRRRCLSIVQPQLPLRADLPSRPSPQCPASHPATAAEVSAPRPFRPPARGRTAQLSPDHCMAFERMGATMALASVVKNPNSSCSPSTGALFGPRTPRHLVHNPAKANIGRRSSLLCCWSWRCWPLI
jgi:hypothetical protein